MKPEHEQALQALREVGGRLQVAAGKGAPTRVLDPLLAEMRRLDDGIRAHLTAELAASRPATPRIPGPVRVRRLARAA